MAILKDSTGKEIQHVHGSIDPDGNKKFGEGFRSQKLRMGLYAIEFDKPFLEMPAAVCTIFGGEWETFNKSITVLEVSEHYVIFGTSSPDRPEDCGFTFIAFGNV